MHRSHSEVADELRGTVYLFKVGDRLLIAAHS
jgi:hypothetical protein